MSLTPATLSVNKSGVIRVFLSSTFRDFMQERDLLVKRVFPELRRKACERGIDVVDVDLRWGITEKESRQGKVLPICLAEINRCRPYFVGMLGERYGWVPPDDEDTRINLKDEAWVQEHLGHRSVTELEILHGVLNNPEMADRAFFYFRDPAWSQAQCEPGFVCESTEEAAKLADLKQRIRISGFPLVEEQDLPDPEALARCIGADLWALIDQQFPEGEQPDALQKEARKHADYRRSRTGAGQYIGGQGYIEQLEGWLEEGGQQILITGESGAGKSALIANWIEAHQQNHPGDVIYAHHLGCTNDANALRPLLARLIDTASGQLLEAGVITEALAVPEDWWELVARVAETLQSLGRWCEGKGKRWIWVLDGLDRLDPDDQNALPWLPQNMPAGVQVVTSALACPARSILSDRGYTTLTIKPLAAAEQEQLIQRYLQRYTKELDGELRQQILNHPLAGSPLFLKVLLEELRQCGRHDTLKQQLDFYLSSQTVDDLYERALERLENDGSGEAVRKVMTAIWASRAGLSETELLAITDLKPLQWAPIDLALEKAFGRNGNRLVFDHNYLRIAVQDRYLPTDVERRQAHSGLADWYQDREGWDERDSEELPWQLQQAGRFEDLRDWLLVPGILANLQWDRGSRETINYWLTVRNLGDGELDELIADELEEEIKNRGEDVDDLIWFVDRIAELFDDSGLYREPLLRLRTLSIELEEASNERSEESMLSSLQWLANAHRDLGKYDEALPLYQRCLAARERLFGIEHPDTLPTIGNLGLLYYHKGDYEQAEAYFERVLEASERQLGPDHPFTITTLNNLAALLEDMEKYEQAEVYFERLLEVSERQLGPDHPSTLSIIGNYASLLQSKGDYGKAGECYNKCLKAQTRMLGPEHPDTLTTMANLALLFQDKGDYEQATVLYMNCIRNQKQLLGPEHPSTLTTMANLAGLYREMGSYQQAEDLYRQCISGLELALGVEHSITQKTVYNLADMLSHQSRWTEAIPLRRRELAWCRAERGDTDPRTLFSINDLAIDLRETGCLEEAEQLFRALLAGCQAVLGPEDFQIGSALGGLARTLEAAGRLEDALTYSQQALHHRATHEGPDAWWTNRERLNLARILLKAGYATDAVSLLDQIETSMSNIIEFDDGDLELKEEADDLRTNFEGSKG